MKPVAHHTSEVDQLTGLAPTFRPMVEAVAAIRAAIVARPGLRLGDFELLRLLGKGSFGQVFLARQMSLDRRVALKVTANWGTEARTLAQLEHEHIVSVYSESIESDLRLLCMQYVAGTTLQRVIQALHGLPRHERNGRAILEAVDQLNPESPALRPAGLRGREQLAADDRIQAVCRIGARLAEALEHAHGRGILHRDIKPANILVGQYGRPLLTDFNLASRHDSAAGAASARPGGTSAYMAPEHLDAFNPEGNTPPEAVDRRSDIYALGVVLFELLTGDFPFPAPPFALETCETLRAMAAVRRSAVPLARHIDPGISQPLDSVLRRCLDPDPERRYPTAGDLAQALQGCSELRRVEREFPAPGPLTRAALARPFLLLAVLSLLPHFLGSAVNICYNSVRIVSALTAAQQDVFAWSVLAYNLLMYPACLAFLVARAAPAWRAWRNLARGQITCATQMTAARRGVLRWPLWAVVVSCVGWLPGAVLFPLAISAFAAPVGAEVFGHFAVSFTVSGLIALTYSYFAVRFIGLRVLVPRLWVDGQDFNAAARAAIGSPGPRLRLFQLQAGMIPLVGALLLIGVGPEISGYRTFRLLVIALIGLGMAGFGLATAAHNLLSRTLVALMRPDGEGRNRGSM
jgi:serine/threonine protein kinase